MPATVPCMTELLISIALPEPSPFEDRPTWTVRGEQRAQVTQHQLCVDIELAIDGQHVAILNPGQAYALGLALLAAAQGPSLPRDVGEYWGSGNWRRPGD